jgi:hypothetical protein
MLKDLGLEISEMFSENMRVVNEEEVLRLQNLEVRKVK